MPRLPVDGKRVVEHRITLGTKERQLLDQATFSYSANRWMTPILAALSDVTFLATFGIALALIIDRLLPGVDWRGITEDMTPEQLNDWLETQNIVGGTIGAGIGAIIFSAIGAPWLGAGQGYVGGNLVVEGGEWVVEETGEVIASAAAANPTAFTALMIGLLRLTNSVADAGRSMQPGANGGSDSGGGGGGGY